MNATWTGRGEQMRQWECQQRNRKYDKVSVRDEGYKNRMKNTLEGVKSRLGGTEEHHLEDRILGIIQSGQQKEKAKSVLSSSTKTPQMLYDPCTSRVLRLISSKGGFHSLLFCHSSGPLTWFLLWRPTSDNIFLLHCWLKCLSKMVSCLHHCMPAVGL